MTDNAQSPPITDFFNADMAQAYDERNSKLAIIQQDIHFLINLVLDKLPDQARILCVGAGTGAEILALSRIHPQWRFVALDPSKSMLDVCRKRLEQENLLDRCEFIHGYVEDIEDVNAFDAVLSIMVAHFIPPDARTSYYKKIYNLLKPDAYFISTEISYDLESEQFHAMLENWGQIQKLMGATPESLENLPNTLRNILSVISPQATESMIKKAGFELPVQFFQNFMAYGWYAKK
ncbi:class I SAM-dependent methyltransferase [Hirschia baltica]|uniref:Methyltransferase type 11 n=1 Tax=Hirschia baltica (strain ATCC 49814 / DSM 5838 / IFAM 1418) TaxID=582402 RepID=C6XMW7_HIRBI|nr:class I SAM-dependent methyltransferase [Hirschia baltica]ACT58137.1 Methyltransferase type 11 [Hirschia baltica ATCC 49814]